MLSSTLKRSAATLGVVAGVLAAAGPAGAQIGPGMVGVTASHTEQISMGITAEAAGTQVGSEGVKAPDAAGWMRLELIEGVVVKRGLAGSTAPRANLNDVEAIDFNTIDSGPGDDN